jgi:ribA/ribD-fused uncharacterized protein
METEPFDIQALQSRVQAGWVPRFLFFWGHTAAPGASLGKECLSQWYPAPFEVDGETYRTAEHFMMAQKALLFGDIQIAQQIRTCRSPAEAKELGRHVRDFDEDRWESHRSAIVETGSYAKFSQNADLRAFLLSSKQRVLVEASPKDTIWGIGLAEKDAAAQDPRRWRGLNLLGFALMRARARIAGEL